MQLTFASYNIRKAIGMDRRRDPDRIIAVLREINADIIALQEVDRRIGQRESVISRAALDDTPWKPAAVARRVRSLGWHGNALLIRRGFKVAETSALDLPTLEPRGAVSGSLVCHGQRVQVVGMHLDLSGLRRREQIMAVLKHIEQVEPCPTVLMGDFNQWGLRTGAMRIFEPEWQPLSPGRSFPSNQPLARLDRIVASRHWRCLHMAVHHSPLAAQASDHLPIVATLELPNI